MLNPHASDVIVFCDQLGDTVRAAPTLLQQQQQQQQQDSINKQIKLQKYCPQLAKLFDARQ